MDYFIGQRVLLNGNEIGTVVKPEHNNMKGVWVWPASRLWPSCYDPRNVKPLPNGQL